MPATPDAACRTDQRTRVIVADENAWHAARSFARRLFGDAAGDLLTVADELVVNAVRHAQDTTSMRVSFQRLRDGVLVEVSDGDPRPPVPRVPGDLDGSGRGLAIVEGLSTRWGWRPNGAGKTVFAVVSSEGPQGR